MTRGRHDGPVPCIRLSVPADPEALGAAWRELEDRAAGSFFQSWTWTGCLFPERFPDPVLLEAEVEGRRIAMALFNRRRGTLGDTLFLGESGRAEYDDVLIEHNGILTEIGGNVSLPTLMLAAALRRERGHLPIMGIVLSGTDIAGMAMARQTGGVVHLRQTRAAPWIDLSALGSGSSLAHVSANTRYQIRRSERRYSRRGELRLTRATSVTDAHTFLDALAALHQTYWKRRGRSGSFSNPRFLDFHHALIDRGFSRCEIDLLRATAGETVIGYLYNFRYRNRVFAYQSGFAYGNADRHEKPGLTCHHMAIEACRSEGVVAYDFLGGADRYKTSFANASEPLHWLTLHPVWSPSGLLELGRTMGARLVAGLKLPRFGSSH